MMTDGDKPAKVVTLDDKRGQHGDNLVMPEDLVWIVRAMTIQKRPIEAIAQVYAALRAGCQNLSMDQETELSALMAGLSQKQRSITDDVRGWVTESKGIFGIDQVAKDLCITARPDKRVLSNILNRLCTEGIIDRHGEKRGQFRLRETDLEEMDLDAPDGGRLDIQWPLGMETFFWTAARNIIVVAGEPDSGKTAFMLNFAAMNMKQHEIHYLNSEMGVHELKNRLSKFGDVKEEDWRRVHWYERSDNFADAIFPDAINVIDFMEVVEDHWRVGVWMKQIHDRLRKGICVIAMQKEKGKDTARGGHVTLEKPRLYLTMGPGLCRVVKAKNWVFDTANPNGLERKWRLVQGCHFIPDGLWGKPESVEQPASRRRRYE